MGRHWGLGLAGGTLQLGSYGIAIWAMTVAPIAIVAALRETSVLFGAAIAVVFLKEPLRAGPCRRGIDDRRRFDVDPAVLSLVHPATQADRRKVLVRGADTACSWALRRDQVVQADRAQPLEILGQVHVPQRDRLLPCQAERSEAAAGLGHHARRAPVHV